MIIMWICKTKPTSLFVFGALVLGLCFEFGTGAMCDLCTVSEATANATLGELCSIPFLYNFTLQYGCVTLHGVPSCPVATETYGAPKEGSWAPCTCTNSECITKETSHSGGKTIPAGIQCVFPFRFQHLIYYSCAKAYSHGQQGWCPTETDENGDFPFGQWADCNCEPTGTDSKYVCSNGACVPGESGVSLSTCQENCGSKYTCSNSKCVVNNTHGGSLEDCMAACESPVYKCVQGHCVESDGEGIDYDTCTKICS
eukprot:m.55866 g.55866  ORF g.55866 m.55866 type:complete len:256 (-) comp11008_c0_seq2:2856-3623(-)